MSEAEWMAGNSSLMMLHFARSQLSFSKWVFYACALCRRDWHLLPSDGCREAVEVFELYCDTDSK